MTTSEMGGYKLLDQMLEIIPEYVDRISHDAKPDSLEVLNRKVSALRACLRGVEILA